MLRTVAALALLVTLLLPMATATPAAASTEIHVYPGQSIQAAVNVAQSGDTIIVHTGIYPEQVMVTGFNGLTIRGLPGAVVRPTTNVVKTTYSTTSLAPIITVKNATDVTIKGLDIDGSARMGLTGNLFGVVYHNASGAIESNIVQNTRKTNLGSNENAIYIRSDGGAASVVKISANTVRNYAKNGITANMPGTVATIMGNTVTGVAHTANIAQNGIQIGYGGTGVIHSNKVNGNWYTGNSWTAGGILIFESDEVSVQGNSVTNSQSGITVETWGWVRASASNNKIVNNTVKEAKWGVTVDAVGYPPYSTTNATANNNKVVNNTITAQDGDTGVYVGAYTYSPRFAPVADNNKIINNDISGYEYPIYDEGTRTKVHANASD